jgi:hypothetical protein
LATAAKFTRADWAVLAEAAVLLPYAEAAARRVSPARLLAWAAGRHSAERATLGADDVRRIAWLVATAANHHVIRVPCLARSLALARILARRGVDAEVRVGVRPEPGGLAAHAWVEWRGRALNEDAHVHDRFGILEPSQ